MRAERGYEEESRHLGRLIFDARQEAGLSQGELAKRVAVHRNTLFRYESGFAMPVFVFAAICRELKVSPVDMLDKAGKKVKRVEATA